MQGLADREVPRIIINRKRDWSGLVKKRIVDKNGKATFVWVKPNDDFKTWFKGSKVVDEKGQPLLVYHRTNVEFDEFDNNKQSGGWLSKGIYFSKNSTK